MALDYLEDLEAGIESGDIYFAIPGTQQNIWHLVRTLDASRPIARRTASSNHSPTPIYRLVNRMATSQNDFYFVVRKILEPGSRGEPNFQWTLVGTREVAEMVRDVSLGPTPYFGAVIEETVQPE